MWKKLANLRIVQNCYYICSRIDNRIVITMNIEFEDVSLEELYVSGTTKSYKSFYLKQQV